MDVIVQKRKMKTTCFIFVLCFARSLTILSLGKETDEFKPWNAERFPLPSQWRYGVATSAYQVEGAWDEDGKGESIWDRYMQTHPELFAKGPNATDACDSYHNYLRDVEMLREIGVDFYRFSISWSRVLPTGFADSINFKALEYYKNLLDELYKYKIESFATMYHYDLPQPLQDLGGWTNPEVIDWFADYARILFTFLPQVRYWIPIYQPSVCFQMYDSRNKVAPGLDAKGTDDYLCVKHMLLAHATAYRMFQEEFQNPAASSRVGLSLALNWADPIGYDNKDAGLMEITNDFREFTIDLYIHPIYGSNGGWPPRVKSAVARNSKAEGLKESRLPKFTEKEIEFLKRTSDFIGVNYYTTYHIDRPQGEAMASYPAYPLDINVELTQNEGWTPSKTEGVRSAPYGFHRLCVYLNQRYRRPPLIITEYGWSTSSGRRDNKRVEVIREFLKASITALMDGSDLRGFTLYSLMDSIEWTDGTTKRFGLYEVDFKSPEKTRKPRLSAHYLRHLIETNLIKEVWQPYSKNLSLEINPRKTTVRTENTEKTEL